MIIGGQLAAGGVDVRAEVLAESVVNFILGENGLELLDGGIGWLLEGGRSVAVVVADEVDVEEAEAVRGGADYIGDGLRMSGAVVFVLEEDVGQEDFAVGDGQMTINSGHDLLDRIGGGDGHELGPFFIEGVVEGKSKVDVGVVASESFDAGNDTNGGNG